MVLKSLVIASFVAININLLIVPSFVLIGYYCKHMFSLWTHVLSPSIVGYVSTISHLWFLQVGD